MILGLLFCREEKDFLTQQLKIFFIFILAPKVNFRFIMAVENELNTNEVKKITDRIIAQVRFACDMASK